MGCLSLKYQDKTFSTFEGAIKSRSFSSRAYMYGFQRQEVEDEIHGKGSCWSYNFRIHDARLGRFFAVDPLAPDFPWNSTYAFSENMLIHAIELEGLEAFFIHGTTSSPDRWNTTAIATFKNITNNTTTNADFSWESLDGKTNNSNDRYKAAKLLVEHIKANKVEGEEVTLIGHSHGGNVAIQAAKLYFEETGESVNLITIATPTYESNEKKLMEDPGTDLGQKAINDHIHIWNEIDGVQGGFAGGETYTSTNTKNYEIDVSSEYRESGWKRKGPLLYYDPGEWLDAHSFDVDHPELIQSHIDNGTISKLKKVEE